MRGLSLIFLLHFLAVTFAPGCLVADFLLERSRIERELCVQRMVPEEVRTCHGECQLSKRMAHLDQRAENLPNELKRMHIGETLLRGGLMQLLLPLGGSEHPWAHLEALVADGHPWAAAPVPWC